MNDTQPYWRPPDGVLETTNRSAPPRPSQAGRGDPFKTKLSYSVRREYGADTERLGLGVAYSLCEMLQEITMSLVIVNVKGFSNSEPVMSPLQPLKR